jgi:hypothetical protein
MSIVAYLNDSRPLSTTGDPFRPPVDNVPLRCVSRPLSSPMRLASLLHLGLELLGLDSEPIKLLDCFLSEM